MRCVHSIEERTERLGSLQELYERFPVRNLIRYSPPIHYTGGTVQCTGMGPSSITSSMVRSSKRVKEFKVLKLLQSEGDSSLEIATE